MNEKLLYELIRVAINTADSISVVPSTQDWEQVFREANKQALQGILLEAVNKICCQNEIEKPGPAIIYQWISNVTTIEARNALLDTAAKQLYLLFNEKGIRNCVLKGQGLARLYPDPQKRQPGDIDLWIEGNRDDILSVLKRGGYKIGPVVIHHVEAFIVEGVETEIHFMPIWLYNPFYNYRLQRYFKYYQNEQFSNFDSLLGFCYPKPTFNSIYCLVHIFHHFLEEGVGMRQVIDYYYVLTNKDCKRDEAVSTLRTIGLLKFVGAMMYVLKEVCGMKAEYMICAPLEKHGKVLLSEILATGNMGQYDSRYIRTYNESVIKKYIRKAKRWNSLLNLYPSEVLFIPLWKLWHWCWRKTKGYA